MAQRSTGSKGKSGARKYSRNSSYCKMYADRNTRERNKLRKVKRHLKRQPDDTNAAKWLAAH